jgi:hypothetical protein
MEKRSNIEGEEEIQTITNMGLVLQCPKRSSTLFLFLTKKENRVHPHRSRHTQR